MSEQAPEAQTRLSNGPRLTIREALREVPDVAGLYAVYGDNTALATLDLPSDEDPLLYVGKAERSLVSRDLRTHFATGKTGSSTLRRSLASLLVDELDLVAVPRNLDKPDGSANFGLAADGDARLTRWMHEHLTLTVWTNPLGVVLSPVETAVLASLQPPLNLAKVAKPWKRLKDARARMAAAARAWQPSDAAAP